MSRNRNCERLSHGLNMPTDNKTTNERINHYQKLVIENEENSLEIKTELIYNENEIIGLQKVPLGTLENVPENLTLKKIKTVKFNSTNTVEPKKTSILWIPTVNKVIFNFHQKKFVPSIFKVNVD